MRKPRVRFSMRGVMIAIALATLFAHYVVKPTWEYYRWDPRTRLVLWKLGMRMSLPSRGTMSLEELLKAIKSETAGPGDTGIPIYVDPIGLREVGRTMQSAVVVGAGPETVRDRLSRALKPLRLVYSVKDGLLIIESVDSTAGEGSDGASTFVDAMRIFCPAAP